MKTIGGNNRPWNLRPIGGRIFLTVIKNTSGNSLSVNEIFEYLFSLSSHDRQVFNDTSYEI